MGGNGYRWTVWHWICGRQDGGSGRGRRKPVEMGRGGRGRISGLSGHAGPQVTGTDFSPEFFFAIANLGLLTGIFFRLGGLSKAHDDFSRRLEQIERKT